MDNKHDNLRLDKYLGALLGAAIGDALGWPNEQNSNKVGNATPVNKELFQIWSRRCGGRFWSHEEEINAGEYSDDTQMIIATARSLRYGNNWNRYFTRIEIPAWLSYERGGGGATKRAAEVWKKGKMPWKLEANNLSDVKRYFDAGGNGVAMRILPHIFKNEDMIEEVMHQVVLNGIFTHGHPRALVGANLYADALICLANHTGTLGYGELVNLLLERRDKWSHFPKIQKLEEWLVNADTVLKKKYMDIWDNVVGETIDLLYIAKEGLKLGALDMGNDVLKKLGCFDKKVNGAGTVTAVSSIYLSSKYASNPHMGLIEAANLSNSDTDTLASMVGGLLGMLHGTEWISVSWLDIQDYEFLKKLIRDVYQESKNETALSTNAVLIDTANISFKSKLKEAKQGDTILALPFNALTVLEKRLNKPNAKGISVHTIKLISEEGQTVFIKTFEKSVKKSQLSTEEKENKNLSTHNDMQLAMDKVINNTNEKISTIINKSSITTNVINDDSNGKQTQKVKGEFPNNTVTIRKQVLINANRLRSFANVLPENMPTDQYLFLISDVMMEIERAGTGKLDEKTMFILKERWKIFNITVYNIEKIIRILLKY